MDPTKDKTKNLSSTRHRRGTNTNTNAIKRQSHKFVGFSANEHVDGVLQQILQDFGSFTNFAEADVAREVEALNNMPAVVEEEEEEASHASVSMAVTTVENDTGTGIDRVISLHEGGQQQEKQQPQQQQVAESERKDALLDVNPNRLIDFNKVELQAVIGHGSFGKVRCYLFPLFP